MTAYSRPLPKIVQQPQMGDPDNPIASPVCWAAALSSWLKASRNSDWSMGMLVQRFAPFCPSGSSLDLGYFGEVADALFVQMEYEELSGQDLTFGYLYDKLVGSDAGTGSYLYIILEGKNPAHAVVGYGAKSDSTGEYLGLMDPLRGVHAAAPLSSFRQKASDFLVGWAKY
jgi:hypothetical protein